MALFACLGHASASQPAPETLNSTATAGYDQVIAHIPHDRAAIASVALAEVNIALHYAKKRTEDGLCHGNWTPSGEALRQFGPRPVAQRAEQKIWLYQSWRKAHPLACDGVSRAQFFLEMSRHLPAWISIRPAGQTTAFNQGFERPLPSAYLATR